MNHDWSGSIDVDGLPARGTPRRQFARSVQMVFQDPYASLHPRHLIGHAIAEPMRIHGMANVEGRTMDLLRLIGLHEKFAYRYPHELSGPSPVPSPCRPSRDLKQAYTREFLAASAG